MLKLLLGPFQNQLARKIVGMHSETCPEIVIDLNNKMMVQFIWSHLGMPGDQEIDDDLEKKTSFIMQLFPVDL